MNRELSRMARRSDVIHDVDCIYRNTAKGHWCMFEWKYPGEKDSSMATLSSLSNLDEMFSMCDRHYVGLFLVRLGTSMDEFPFDDSQQCTIEHLHHGLVIGTKTYSSGARSAVQYILDYGRLL